jgi:hypothetical protein
MPAFNVVRFRVKAGHEDRFVDAHRKMQPQFKGFLGGNLIKTGDQTFCLIGEWRNLKTLAAARPQMISVLDVVRDMLEDLGGDLGVTDPVSGETVARMAAPKAKKKKGKVKAKKKDKKKDRKK